MSKRTLLLPVPPMNMRHNGTPAASPARSLSEKLARLEATACVRRLSDLYSRLLEEDVSPCRTLRLLHAQCAIACLLLPLPLPLGMRAACLAWSALAAWQCRPS